MAKIIRTPWAQLGGAAIAFLILLACEGALRMTEPGLGALESVPVFAARPANDLVWPVTDTLCATNRGLVFSARKAPGTLRIFAMGSSTTYGTFSSFFHSFPILLERILEKAVRGYDVEVIIAAAPGVSTIEVLSSLRKILKDYSPDLIIVYAGNNEFHRLMYHKKLNPHYDSRVEYLRSWFWKSYLYRALVHSLTGKLNQQRGEIPGFEISDCARIRGYDYDLIRDFYRQELENMACDCRAARVPLLLCKMAVNESWEDRYLTGGPPDIQQALEEAGRCEAMNRLKESLAVLDRALRANDDTRLHFALGKLYLKAGKSGKAREEFEAAVETDPLAIRALPSFGRIIQEVGQKDHVPVCDIPSRLRAYSPSGILVDRLFHDHCHPNFKVHELMARFMAESIVENGLLPGTRKGATLQTRILKEKLSREDMLDLEQWPSIAELSLVGVPHEIDRYKSILLARSGKDEIERSHSLFSSLPEKDAPVPLLAVAGHCAFHIREFERASLFYKRALVLAPQDLVLYRDLGHSLLFGGRYGEALGAYEEFRRRGGRDPRVERIIRTLRLTSGSSSS